MLYTLWSPGRTYSYDKGQAEKKPHSFTELLKMKFSSEEVPVQEHSKIQFGLMTQQLSILVETIKDPRWYPIIHTTAPGWTHSVNKVSNMLS